MTDRIETDRHGTVWHVRECGSCGGDGRMEATPENPESVRWWWEDCEDCDGAREVRDEWCQCDLCMHAVEVQEMRRIAC